jgi:hypothetical protein
MKNEIEIIEKEKRKSINQRASEKKISKYDNNIAQ